ncbi:MAG TPA: hypothetical protein VFC21_06040 [Bryobacteraceae bacterium]|nr:hypothetical protein [Bryobacteraceae bacterium]
MAEIEPAIPHRNLSEAINRGIVGSEIEGGVHLGDLPDGACLEVETENHLYAIVKAGPGLVSISGHPRYCPDPIEVRLGGSSWGGSLLKSSYIGRGMRLEFWHPSHDLVTTSRIRGIRQRS